MKENILRRLLSNCRMTPEGCWEWTAYRNKDGYGQIKYDRKVIPVHRMAFFIFRGFDLFSPLKVLHKCDNPPCWNPEHLFPGTQPDNVRDMIEKGRQPRKLGSFNPNAKLKEVDVLEIKKRLVAGEKQIHLSLEFGVCPASIAMINTGRNWNHLKT